MKKYMSFFTTLALLIAFVIQPSMASEAHAQKKDGIFGRESIEDIEIIGNEGDSDITNFVFFN